MSEQWPTVADTVWIVSGDEGADFVAEHRHMAMEHALEVAEIQPGPWGVTEFVRKALYESLQAENARLTSEVARLTTLSEYGYWWLNLERELAKVYMTVETMADTCGISIDALHAKP